MLYEHTISILCTAGLAITINADYPWWQNKSFSVLLFKVEGYINSFMIHHSLVHIRSLKGLFKRRTFSILIMLIRHHETDSESSVKRTFKPQDSLEQTLTLTMSLCQNVCLHCVPLKEQNSFKKRLALSSSVGKHFIMFIFLSTFWSMNFLSFWAHVTLSVLCSIKYRPELFETSPLNSLLPSKKVGL